MAITKVTSNRHDICLHAISCISVVIPICECSISNKMDMTDVGLLEVPASKGLKNDWTSFT